MGSSLGLRLEGLAQQGSHLFVIDSPGGSGPGFLIQTNETLAQEAATPFAHRGAGQPQLHGNAAVVKAVSGQQDDFGPLRQGLRERPGTAQGLQFLSHPCVYRHWRNRSTRWHGFSFTHYFGKVN